MNMLYKYKYVLIGHKTHTGQIPPDTKHVCTLPHTKKPSVHLHVVCLKSPHRMESTREASSNRPARGARARAAGAGGRTVAGLTRGGRKQARVRARKTKQLSTTSKKELKVELAKVCTWTWFFTWRG